MEYEMIEDGLLQGLVCGLAVELRTGGTKEGSSSTFFIGNIDRIAYLKSSDLT